jgi:hypothetical protein
MAGMLLGIQDHLGEAAMQPSPQLTRGVGINHRAQQGMGEPDHITVQLDHARLGGPLQPAPDQCRSPRGLLEDGQRRPRQRRHRQQRSTRLDREPLQAETNQLA